MMMPRRCNDSTVNEAARFLKITSKEYMGLITKEPIGVVAAIVPWNYPLWMAIWKIAPALITGNSVILKPAEQSPMSAIKIGALLSEAGLPDGVFSVLPGDGLITGKQLCLHNDIDCVAFTGSGEVGKLVLQYSGQSNMKRVQLECGGKSPNIIEGSYQINRAEKKIILSYTI